MRRVFVSLFVASAILYACSEATDGVVPDGGTAGVDAAAEGGGGGGGDASPSTPDASIEAGSARVLINEISGGDEWVELVNPGPSAEDISGFGLADTDKDTGGPKLGEAVTFPEGTILSPNAYVVVRGGGVDAGKSCPDGGQSYCFFAEFGISNKNGETIFLLDRGQQVVGQVVYPPDASSGDESWSRIPSGDPNGTFVTTPTSTPGGANVGP